MTNRENQVKNLPGKLQPPAAPAGRAPARTSDRLLARLRQAGLELPEGARLERTYAGPWDRARGAWIWRAVGSDGAPLGIGSSETMTDLVRAKRWNLRTDDDEITVSVSLKDAPEATRWDEGREFCPSNGHPLRPRPPDAPAAPAPPGQRAGAIS